MRLRPWRKELVNAATKHLHYMQYLCCVSCCNNRSLLHVSNLVHVSGHQLTEQPEKPRATS